MTDPQETRRVTIPQLRKSKADGEKLVMLTAYDYPSARVLDAVGVDMLLVGDSLAMVVLGHENTLSVTMDEMLHHTRAVCRGRKRALVVGDMPYLSYHISLQESLANAGRFIKEAGADAVKLEGGRKRCDLIKALGDCEIPVMGHIGLTPQSVNALGGFKVQGKTSRAAEELIKDAIAVEQAGAFSMVLEGIPDELAAVITAEVSIPTIGIGAGPHCDGQVLVFHDMLGLYESYVPKFVRRYEDLHGKITAAVSRYIDDVRAGSFPSQAESYHASSKTKAKLAQRYNQQRDEE
jgi:3-methyl-2-oxobutanoate hydroxymethyltransferase